MWICRMAFDNLWFIRVVYSHVCELIWDSIQFFRIVWNINVNICRRFIDWHFPNPRSKLIFKVKQRHKSPGVIFPSNVINQIHICRLITILLSSSQRITIVRTSLFWRFVWRQFSDFRLYMNFPY